MKLKKSVLVRLIVCVVMLFVVLGIGSATDGFGFGSLGDAISEVSWSRVLRLFAMIFGVIAFTTLVEVILGTLALIRHLDLPRFRPIYAYIGVALIFIQWIIKNILLLAG